MGSSISNALGAIAGGVLGPVGSLVGGIKGLGAPDTGGDLNGINAVQAQAAAAANRQQGQLNELEPQQTAFGKQLADQAMGKGPSLAEMQLRSAQDRNLSQQLAAAKGMRTPNAGLQSRNLINQGMMQGQQTAQAGAQARLAEQQANQGAFGNYLSQQQGYNSNLLSGAGQAAGNAYAADAKNKDSSNAMIGNLIGTAGSVAAMFGFSDKNLKKNIKPVTAKYDGTVTKTGPKKMATGGLAGGMDVSQLAGLGKMLGSSPQPTALDGRDLFGSYLNSKTQSQSPDLSGMAGMFKSPSENAGIATSALDNNILQNQINPFMPQVPTMTAAQGGKVPGQASVEGDSEENDTVHALLSPDEVVVPRTVAKAGPEVSGKFVSEASNNPSFNSKKFLDHLQAYTYEYKNQKHGQGQQTSVMAQDLEKSPEGKQMVVDTPEGKMVNYAKGYGTILAAQADLNKRLSEIEARKQKKGKV